MNDYMATEHEMKKQPDALPFFREVAGDDQQVFDALWSFWNFAHVFDDLIDEIKWPDEKKELAFKALHDFTRCMMLNPFVQCNVASIFAMMTSAITRCLDGDKMAKSESLFEAQLAPAVRCGDIDVIMHIVYLCKGWEGLREYSAMRQYDEKG
jgi:hypothetical protein